MCYKSLRDALHGVMRADESLYYDKKDNFMAIHGHEQMVRDLQLMFRRTGINRTKVCECVIATAPSERYKVGSKIWALLIDCTEKEFKFGEPWLNTHIKNFTCDYPRADTDFSEEQVVVDVIPLEGAHRVYCFTEHQRNKGVFGNCLTGQCLVETFPARHKTKEEFLRTLKFAYLYAKTVTLGRTTWPETNRVMLRNRRIGTSMSGLAQFVAQHGLDTLREWSDEGYKVIRAYDEIYSNWFCIPMSIKTTSIKPSGCRPGNALTATSRGLLTLDELMVAHTTEESWCDFTGDASAIQDNGASNKITKTFKNGVAEVFRAKLSFGMRIESTANHQWAVIGNFNSNRWKNGYAHEVKWKRMDELEEDDIVCVKAGVYSNDCHASLVELETGESKDVAMPKKMTERLSWLLGFLWASGDMNCESQTIHFRINDSSIRDRIRNYVRTEFGDGNDEIYVRITKEYPSEIVVDHPCIWKWFMINNISIYRWTISDRLNIIPTVVRSSATHDILSFIAGFFDGKGRIVRRNKKNVAWSMRMDMSDLKFARHVFDVCWAVGVPMAIYEETKRNRGILRGILLHGDENWPVLADYSVKVSEHMIKYKTTNLGGDRECSRRMCGRVQAKAKSIGMRETFDIEVDDQHWYYAGAVKSHNTVSLLAGATPGMHFPVSRFYLRRVRLPANSDLLAPLIAAGIRVEPETNSKGATVVVEFPVDAGEGVRAVHEVSMWEQLAMAAFLQRYWADNQVSCTVSFHPATEGPQIPHALNFYQYQLKGISFLPNEDHNYQQPPYEPITEQEYIARKGDLIAIDYSSTASIEPVGEKYCTSDVCTRE